MVAQMIKVYFLQCQISLFRCNNGIYKIMYDVVAFSCLVLLVNQPAPFSSFQPLL